jgi:flagellar biosynthetic protein FliR
MTTAWDMDLLRLAPTGLAATVRIGAMVSLAPPFAHAAVPRQVRALLAMALAVGIVPSLPASAAIASSWTEFGMNLGAEALIGVAMGLGLSMVFAGATWAGGLVAGQMGLNLAESYDPRRQEGSASLGQAYWLLAIVVFMGANGHLALVRGIRASFDAVPALGAAQMQQILPMLIGLLQSATMLALHLAAPVMLATLVADLALGMVGRTIPPMGIMTAGVTIRTVVALMVLVAATVVTATVLQGAMLNGASALQFFPAGK